MLFLIFNRKSLQTTNKKLFSTTNILTTTHTFTSSELSRVYIVRSVFNSGQHGYLSRIHAKFKQKSQKKLL